MKANKSQSFSVPLSLAPNSYEHISYNISRRGYAQLSLSEQNGSFDASSIPFREESANLTGIGVYSYHNPELAGTVTVSINIPSGSVSSNSALNFTATEVYHSSINPVIFAASIMIIAIFGVGISKRISFIYRNPEKYWNELNSRYRGNNGLKKFRVVKFRRFPDKQWHISSPIIFFISLVLFALSYADSSGYYYLQVLNFAIVEVAIGFLIASVLIFTLNVIMDDRGYPLRKS